MDGYLTKPTKLQVLANMLDLWRGKTAASLFGELNTPSQ